MGFAASCMYGFCRGFTTLSATLGHLVIALHNGLLHAIANETQIPALVNMLKTLETLMLSAAYNRLPPDLLTRCIEVSLHFQSAASPKTDTVQQHAAAVICQQQQQNLFMACLQNCLGQC